MNKSTRSNATGKNKVKFNIKNIHYAPKKDDGTYETPILLPGGVSISLEAQGEMTPFYADGIKYYVSSSNQGYEGDMEVALITDEFRTAILGEIEDLKKVLIENANNKITEFALGFEIDGDVNSTKLWYYNVTASRPKMESKTNESSIEPSTDTVTVSCVPGIDGTIRAKTTSLTDAVVHSQWFESVYTKQEAVVS